MNQVSKLIAFLFFLVTSFCIDTLAKPDVFFADSDAYDGAYLSHQFEGDKIKFLLSAPITNITLPGQLFDFNDLANYIRNTYVFPSAKLKREFVRMMSMSFESQFQAKEFLQELIRVLESFSETL